MKSKITTILLFISVACFGQSVPNTNTFSLTNVQEVIGWTSLSMAFNNSVDVYFDPTYKGNKDRLSNFRNYTIPNPPSIYYPYWDVTSDSANANIQMTAADASLYVTFNNAVDTSSLVYTVYLKYSGDTIWAGKMGSVDTVKTICCLDVGKTLDVFVKANGTYYRNSNVVVSPTIVDNTAPATPSHLYLNSNGTDINITWWAVSDGSGSVTYQVDESPNGSTAWENIYDGSSTSSDYQGVLNRTYYFRVRAYDANGNYSQYSATVSIDI